MKSQPTPSHLTRRGFLNVLGAGAGTALLASTMTMSGCAVGGAQPSRRLKIGHTGNTWKDEEDLTAIKELGALV